MNDLQTGKAQRLLLSSNDGLRLQELEVRLIRTVTTADVVQELARQSRTTLSTPLLPRFCRLYQEVPNENIFVVERPPAQVELRFQDTMGPVRALTPKFWMPWQVYLARFTPSGELIRQHAYWRPRPLGSLDDALHDFVTPNTYGDGTACMGGSWHPPTGSVDAIFQYLVEFYRASSYHADVIATTVMDRLPEEVRNVEIPDPFMGLPRNQLSGVAAVQGMIRLCVWSQQQDNPAHDVCRLPFPVLTTLTEGIRRLRAATVR